MYVSRLHLVLYCGGGPVYVASASLVSDDNHAGSADGDTSHLVADALRKAERKAAKKARKATRRGPSGRDGAIPPPDRNRATCAASRSICWSGVSTRGAGGSGGWCAAGAGTGRAVASSMATPTIPSIATGGCGRIAGGHRSRRASGSMSPIQFEMMCIRKRAREVRQRHPNRPICPTAARIFAWAPSWAETSYEYQQEMV